jgi:hypothetical protein
MIFRSFDGNAMRVTLATVLPARLLVVEARSRERLLAHEGIARCERRAMRSLRRVLAAPRRQSL